MTVQLSDTPAPDGQAPPAALPGCATVARMLGASPAGTAADMRCWLLIEQPGPWPADALENVLDEAFPAERRELLENLRRSHGLRPLLIRRPGKHQRDPDRPRSVYVGGGEPGNRWLERLELHDLGELAALDLEAVAEGTGGLGTRVDGPLFLVCTHGTKDMCCAVLGRPLASTLNTNHPGRAWEVSHVGGDRWAGNLLVVPDGFLHGQLNPAEAALVAKAALRGQVEPEQLRGRTSARTAWAQFAEIALRRRLDLTGLDDVLAVQEEPLLESDARVVTVRGGEDFYSVTVRRRSTAPRGESRCAGLIQPAGYVAEEITKL
ncbi:sucrase ferredoxin [Amycolatopsis sp. EV170708-02-1]|uniref:sucrase ferredoxin n=1 Tax=Amycolatopsis sp. EV170708-02-1 TaxID=2919322 RepID=UPI001F0BBB3B|nr:sucrase ferredoxin [Amycolatopsis sp. EV170708-02-1]UMP03929.1 sucrase ferredoxin [Amycolatopsis sp. EV170708-02-1]